MPSTTRRQLLAATGVAATGLAGCMSTGCRRGEIGPVEGSWPMDGGGPRQRSYAPAAAGPLSGTSVGWCFQTLTENHDRDVGTPAVARGKPSGLGRGDLASDGPGAVFVPATVRSTDVTRNAYLHTLEAATGEEHLRIPLRGRPVGPPAVTAESIIVAEQLSTERSRFAAFDREYGELRWTHDVDARVTGPPAVVEGSVYVADWSGRIAALDLQGNVRWRRTFDGSGTPSSFREPPAVAGGTLYVAGSGSSPGLFALDAADGSDRWTLPRATMRSGPVLAGDLLLARADGYVQAYDPADGTVGWSANFDLDKRHFRPAADDARAYVATGSRLLAFGLGDGEPDWAIDLEEPVAGRPVVGADAVYAPGRSGLHAFEAVSGERLWRLDRARGTPALADGAVFVPGADGRLLAAVECRGWLC